MKKTGIIAIFSLLFFMQISAQTIISGKVIDISTQDILPGSLINVENEDIKQFITGAITSENGRFVISNLGIGNYIITISFMGYHPIIMHIKTGRLNNVLDLGTIKLEPQVIELGDIMVTGQQQSVNVALDKKSFSAADLITQSGGSALDIMKSLPGVTVDQDGKLLLRGSDKVAILIDGSQSSLTGFGNQKGLDNIPASNIESIEIINNPSAKYDAAGMAGVVNIKFKKEKKNGFNGDIGLSAGIGMLTKRKEDTPTGMQSYSNNPKITPSLNLNYKQDKFNLFFQGYYTNQKKLPNNEFTTRNYSDGISLISQVAENRSQNLYNLKIGIDWKPTDKQTITIFGLYDYEWHIDTTRIGYFDMSNMELTRRWAFNESEGTGFTNFTIQHKYRFQQPGHELSSQFLFTKGWEDESYSLYEELVGGNNTRIFAPEFLYLLQTDYVKPLSFGRFEAGIKGSYRHMPIEYYVNRAATPTFPTSSPIFDNYGGWSKWNEGLTSTYINFIVEFEKIDIEAGLRGEYTNVTSAIDPVNFVYYQKPTDQYDYFDLFPNIRLSYRSNDSHRLSLFYNRRIDRPGEGELRVFPKYDDPVMLKIGNLYLRPQYTQNVEFANKWQWRKGFIYASAYYKMINNYYTRIYVEAMHDNTPIVVKAYQNIGFATNAGIELSFEHELTKYWFVSGSFNGYKNKLYEHKGSIIFPNPQNPIPYTLPEQVDFPWYTKLNSRFTLSKDLQVEINGVYFAARNIPQGRELSRFGLDLGLKKQIVNKQTELFLTASDIFNTMGIRQEINGEGFNAKYENYFETQIIKIGGRYKF